MKHFKPISIPKVLQLKHLSPLGTISRPVRALPSIRLSSGPSSVLASETLSTSRSALSHLELEELLKQTIPLLGIRPRGRVSTAALEAALKPTHAHSEECSLLFRKWYILFPKGIASSKNDYDPRIPEVSAKNIYATLGLPKPDHGEIKRPVFRTVSPLSVAERKKPKVAKMKEAGEEASAEAVANQAPSKEGNLPSAASATQNAPNAAEHGKETLTEVLRSIMEESQSVKSGLRRKDEEAASTSYASSASTKQRKGRAKRSKTKNPDDRPASTSSASPSSEKGQQGVFDTYAAEDNARRLGDEIILRENEDIARDALDEPTGALRGVEVEDVSFLDDLFEEIDKGPKT
ncbi:putative mitochondrial protein [Andalucia godoyi]|uniref:Putative mitochondrial protein n=1 Tax=Andalucia godoyi TaxID=505711 RepID=A0A8K0F330_ANDGO|nr:putative mitochondrial protein [Andalucia godoyi]|eukprot:ANDGO_05283.mRNA.1 putative mitochondrial protein